MACLFVSFSLLYTEKIQKSILRGASLKLKNLLSLTFGVFGALIYAVFNLAAATPFLALSFVFAVIPFWNRPIDLAEILEKILNK